MATSTSTAIELQPTQAARSAQSVTEDPSLFSSDLEPVLQTSRLNDSTVPDGGYGWVVVSACAVTCWWWIGTPYSWGVMQSALVERDVSTPAVLAFVGSLAAALISAMALVNSVVLQKFGARKTAMMSMVLVSLSELLSSFTFQNITALFFTSGFMMGLGVR